MTNTEALYGFFRWLADQPRVYMIGGGYHGGDVHMALACFCKENDLPFLEDGWETKAKIPSKITTGMSKGQAQRGYRDVSV